MVLVRSQAGGGRPHAVAHVVAVHHAQFELAGSDMTHLRRGVFLGSRKGAKRTKRSAPTARRAFWRRSGPQDDEDEEPAGRLSSLLSDALDLLTFSPALSFSILTTCMLILGRAVFGT